jgi:glucose/arabinose dehydrogenase
MAQGRGWKHRARGVGAGLLLALGAALPTRAAQAQVSLQPVTSGLASPVFVTSAGDTRLFVVEQAGRIRIFDTSTNTLRAAAFLDIAAKVSSGGERGLLSMALHPDFATNRLFFVNYTNLDGNTVIERYQVSADPLTADPTSARQLMLIPQPYANHNGGQLQVGPRDGYLYIGMGDGGSSNDPDCTGQRTDTLLGKMLRLDVRANLNVAPYYGIPADNPYRSATDPTNAIPDEIWASGLRNPWRFSFDRSTGDMYIADVGQSAREEIDFVPAGSAGGKNFGWGTMEGTLCLRTTPCPATAPVCNSPALTMPVYDYGHDLGCSITGGHVQRGPSTGALTGKYVYADYCSGRIWSLARNASGVWQNTLLLTAAGVVPSFGEGALGRTFVIVNTELMELVAPAPLVSVPALPGAAAGAGALFLVALGALFARGRTRSAPRSHAART